MEIAQLTGRRFLCRLLLLTAAIVSTIALAACPGPDPEIKNKGAPMGTSPDDVEARFRHYLSKADYEELFPRRIGTALWLAEMPHAHIPEWQSYSYDYYSYENIIAALRRIANIELILEQHEGQSGAWTSKTSVRDKTTGAITTVLQGGGFGEPWYNPNIIRETVDYGSFMTQPNENDRKRELAAWLANMAHETGGGWPTAPGGHFAWGLFYNEENGYAGRPGEHYAVPHADFPPTQGKSYHGRGAKQLSYNYNYGQFSAVLFGDKQVLLDDPERVVRDPQVGLMSSFWFWMTPQPPKPSCHQVIGGNWTPSQQHLNQGWTSKPSFGHTINVINGGVEDNLTIADNRVYSRVGYYQRIAAKIGAVIYSDEKLDTQGVTPVG